MNAVDPSTQSEIEELVRIVRQYGLPEDSARLVAEDSVTRGARKPSAYEVEMERIRRARALDGPPVG
jgi:hypothetical protein